MGNQFRIALAGVLFLVGVPVYAHHAFSTEFDTSKPITLEGVVTNVTWENPHVFFFVDVADVDGNVVNWKCETRGPNGLAKQGWTKNSLKAGDKVTVHGYLARDASHMVDGRKVTLADGRKILSGQNN
ncbi:MAG: hypothetical protein JO323_05265 [Acidobacteriia bacterium]|nr:hypothetical protein [Terriglobia bacterium]